MTNGSEGDGEGAQHAGTELDGCADELGAIVFGGVKAMLVRSWEEGDARGIDDDPSGRI